MARFRPFTRFGVAAGILVLLVALAAAAAGLAIATGGTAASSTGTHSGPTALLYRKHDPDTAHALLRIARRLNNDYATNKDAAVYARWDAASRKVISRATYVRRHRECPSPPEGKVDTYGVTHESGNEWLVHYSIGSQHFTDYWFYVHGRFVFDLPKSNPTAVPLYEASPAKYAKMIGCGG